MKPLSKFLPSARTLTLMCAISAAYRMEAAGENTDLRVLILALCDDLGPENIGHYRKDMRELLQDHPAWRATVIMIERAVRRKARHRALESQGWASYKTPHQPATRSASNA